MFRAIGFVIVIYTLSHLFTNTFVSVDSAATEVFNFIGAAALRSQEELQRR